MNMMTRWDPFRNMTTLQEQVNRLFEGRFQRGREDNSALTTWAPAVDIYETENELVLKADIPDVSEKDIDIQVENNMLTIRGERKFEEKVRKTITCGSSAPTGRSPAASACRTRLTWKP